MWVGSKSDCSLHSNCNVISTKDHEGPEKLDPLPALLLSLKIPRSTCSSCAISAQAYPAPVPGAEGFYNKGIAWHAWACKTTTESRPCRHFGRHRFWFCYVSLCFETSWGSTSLGPDLFGNNTSWPSSISGQHLLALINFGMTSPGPDMFWDNLFWRWLIVEQFWNNIFWSWLFLGQHKQFWNNISWSWSILEEHLLALTSFGITSFGPGQFWGNTNSFGITSLGPDQFWNDISRSWSDLDCPQMSSSCLNLTHFFQLMFFGKKLLNLTQSC